MLIQPTLELRLTGMAEAFEQQLGMPDIGQLAFEDRLGLLLEHEKTSREERRYRRGTIPRKPDPRRILA